ncbi:MAG TPA: bifunctional ornithine acetyltransferase/N-acetylglutamate synthase, partial [Candidatus Avamphibacillus intestinigallinarum]|nr:bifunctional ornithine acetyltransferase/N-acetylglutamate synthase [Candidatus Avamphibacillus intestinigallinarum]
MLSFITTDLNIDATYLQQALNETVNKTFNCVTVDGDTSTNDTVIVMANGCANNAPLTPQSEDWPIFIELLQQVSEDLAKMIAKDGEGATKLIEVVVNHASSTNDAVKIAKSVVGSSLVKTAMYGADANWGRILAAIGYSGVPINPNVIDVAIGDIQMLEAGSPVTFDEETATHYLEQDTIQIYIDVKLGDKSGKAWGCDLTYDYVKINASYRS